MKLYEFGHNLYVSRWPGRNPAEDTAAIRDAGIDVVYSLCTKPIGVELTARHVSHPIPDKRVGEPPLEDLRVIVMGILDDLAQGHRVLVHCIEGRNRSVLAAALAERKRQGWTGLQAWEHATTVRPRCLNNTAFAEWLRGCP